MFVQLGIQPELSPDPEERGFVVWSMLQLATGRLSSQVLEDAISPGDL
jgi:hypothetical protein